MPVTINGTTGEITPATVYSGSSSGSITVQATAVAGTNTLTLPAKTGNIITSADTGTVSQAMLATNVAGNGPAFSAYLSSNQSVSNATYTKVQLNTEVYDTNSNFDNTTNYRFTPTVAGYYLITGSIRISSTSPSTYVWAIYKNGANYAELNVATSPAQYDARSIMQIISMNGTTDYIELYGYCSASSAQTFNAGSNATWLSGCLLRAA